MKRVEVRSLMSPASSTVLWACTPYFRGQHPKAHCCGKLVEEPTLVLSGIVRVPTA